MIVVVATAVGVCSALWSWPRVKRLAALPLRRIELVWLALVIQLVLFEVLAAHIPLWAANAVHFLTYALTVAFILCNLRLPGAWLITAGTLANLVAITANGGTMPANMDAWRRAGLPEIPPDVFENSKALASPRLAFFGDIFAIPAGWPLANVFSIGDVLIVIGGTYLAQRWCRAASAATDADTPVVSVPVSWPPPMPMAWTSSTPPPPPPLPRRLRVLANSTT